LFLENTIATPYAESGGSRNLRRESPEMQFEVNVPLQASSEIYFGCYETFSKMEPLSLDVSHKPESAGETGK
jgi:hypothetical protein